MNTSRVLWCAVLAVALVFGQARAVRALDTFPARIALVIGNGDYPDADRLVNPVNDARDVGAALGSVGFDTDVQVNVDQRDFGRAIDRFIAKLRSNPGALALFYFAGHGTQRSGGRADNLLWPAREKPEDSESSAQRLNVVLSRMHDAGAAAKVVILDACRTVSVAARGGARGLATYDGRIDALIAYAAAVGQVADDNPRERNGLYTKHLLEHLGTAGLSMYQILSRTAESVRTARPQGQLPELRSLAADIRLSEMPLLPVRLPGTNRVETATTADPSANDRALWDAVKASKNPEELRAYLEQFPNGLFAGLARRRIESLTAAARATVAPPPQEPVPQPAAPATGKRLTQDLSIELMSISDQRNGSNGGLVTSFVIHNRSTKPFLIALNTDGAWCADFRLMDGQGGFCTACANGERLSSLETARPGVIGYRQDQFSLIGPMSSAQHILTFYEFRCTSQIRNTSNLSLGGSFLVADERQINRAPISFSGIQAIGR